MCYVLRQIESQTEASGCQVFLSCLVLVNVLAFVLSRVWLRSSQVTESNHIISSKVTAVCTVEMVAYMAFSFFISDPAVFLMPGLILCKFVIWNAFSHASVRNHALHRFPFHYIAVLNGVRTARRITDRNDPCAFSTSYP